MIRANCLFAAVLVILPSVHAFGVTPQSPLSSIRQGTSLNAEKNVVGHFLASAAIMTAIAMGGPALADEVGKETEAPTLFTGETVMVSYSCSHSIDGLNWTWYSTINLPRTKDTSHTLLLLLDLQTARSPWSLYENRGTNKR